MTKNTTTPPNIWEKNNIPALEYCTLPRAAEVLNCKIGDLIHFAEIGAIEFCIKLREFEASLLFPFEWRNPGVWEKKFRNSHNYINKSPLSMFRIKASMEFNNDNAEPIKKYAYQNESSPGIRSPLMFISGFWSLSIVNTEIFFFRKLKGNQEISLTALDFSLKEADVPLTDNGFEDEVIFVSPPTENLYPDGGSLAEERVVEITRLTTEDIYLTRMQIEKIFNGLGKELPNYINGGVLEAEKRSMGNNIKKTHKNQEINASKRESILLAAMYVMENHPEECVRKNGKKSAAAIAKSICDHSYTFFGSEDMPVTNIRVIAEIISDGFKIPSQRKRAGKTF